MVHDLKEDKMDISVVDFKVRREKVVGQSGVLIPDKEVIIREDTNKPLGVVSEKYNFVHHKQVVDLMNEVLKEKKVEKQSIRLGNNGGRMFAEYQLDEPVVIGTLRDGKPDDIKPRLIMTNSYDGSMPLGFIIGGYRLVCSNGLRTGFDVLGIQQKHTSGLALDEVYNSVSSVLDKFQNEVVPMWRLMAEKPVGSVEHVLEELKGKVGMRFVGKIKEYMKERGLDQNQSFWWLYNEFTAYLTHVYQPKSVEGFELKQRSVAREIEKMALAVR